MWSPRYKIESSKTPMPKYHLMPFLKIPLAGNGKSVSEDRSYLWHHLRWESLLKVRSFRFEKNNIRHMSVLVKVKITPFPLVLNCELLLFHDFELFCGQVFNSFPFIIIFLWNYLQSHGRTITFCPFHRNPFNDSCWREFLSEGKTS